MPVVSTNAPRIDPLKPASAVAPGASGRRDATASAAARGESASLGQPDGATDPFVSRSFDIPRPSRRGAQDLPGAAPRPPHPCRPRPAPDPWSAPRPRTRPRARGRRDPPARAPSWRFLHRASRQLRCQRRGPGHGDALGSTTDQDLATQEAALCAAGCQVIRVEKRTGTQREGRTELELLLQVLRPGDTSVITRIDRLARSLKDRQGIVHQSKVEGVTLRVIEQPLNAATTAGKAFLHMLGAFAEFGTNLLRERQMEGIAAARERGVHMGRRPTIDSGEARRLHADERPSPAADARRLGIAGSGVRRFLPGQGAHRRGRRRTLHTRRDALLVAGADRACLLQKREAAPKLRGPIGGRGPCPTRPLPGSDSPGPR